MYQFFGFFVSGRRFFVHRDLFQNSPLFFFDSSGLLKQTKSQYLTQFHVRNTGFWFSPFEPLLQLFSEVVTCTVQLVSIPCKNIAIASDSCQVLQRVFAREGTVLGNIISDTQVSSFVAIHSFTFSSFSESLVSACTPFFNSGHIFSIYIVFPSATAAALVLCCMNVFVSELL